MSPLPVNRDCEWLEADGLGGFASGTTANVNTRRYHALLLSAVHPPADRMVLVNGAAVWLETPSGIQQISSHCYAPGVISDRLADLYEFTAEPWPRWRYALGDIGLEQEILALHGSPVVLVRFRFTRPMPGVRLCVRPLLSGRGFHALHHENGAARFEATRLGHALRFQLYDGVPGVLSLAGATYQHEPDWYRHFLYQRERERGLDDTEDLASPGLLRFDLARPEANWVLAADTPETRELLADRSADAVALDIDRREFLRRSSFAAPLERAAEAYLVRRGSGKTLIAGYPWFGDWGRDTFIALRGLCLATGRFEEARQILLAWAPAVSRGLLPNRFADSALDEPEYNSVDAALWYVLCVAELLASPAAAPVLSESDRSTLKEAVERIVVGHVEGTRHGIRADSDGLLAAGAPGVQLTWMDAKIGDWVVTQRSGKPVEIQALWLNALKCATDLGLRFETLLQRGQASFEARFWNGALGCLFDVVDMDHRPGVVDDRVRPNQIFAAGGLPLTLLSKARCQSVLDVVERELWTPLGPRSLSPNHPEYVRYYEGGVRERDSAYHQGTVWPWLAGPFVEAWVKSRGNTAEAKRAARARFIAPLRAHLDEAGIGHVSEIADGEAPHLPRGCPFQAWSVSELLRLERQVLVDLGDTQPRSTLVRPSSGSLQRGLHAEGER